MQELPKLHRSYYSGAIICGPVHPTEENILLLNKGSLKKNIESLTAAKPPQGAGGSAGWGS